MNNSSFSLVDKTIFITGASSGIGASAAIECSKAGAKVLITGRNNDRLIETYKQLEGSDHQMLSADLTSKNDLLKLLEFLPSLDGLVFCAGLTKTLPVKFISEESIDEIFRTNTISSMLLVQKLLKLKKIKKKGSVIFISSISTTYADKGNSIYAASKGALNSFSKVLALESAVQGIRSNCIQPGFVPSGMLEAGIITEQQLDEERKKYPLGFGRPQDIANGIIYLLSDASRWVTGSVLTIDGGVTLR